MRQIFLVPRLALLLAVFSSSAPARAQNTTTTRPPMPPPTGPRYPTAKQSPPAAVPGARYITYKQLTREQIEQFLLNAQVVAERPAGNGITHTTRVTLRDGKIYHDAHVQTIDVYKPEYRSKEGVEKNFTDSYKYNIAAYRLDKLLGTEMTPVCVYRVMNGKPASLCWWVDDVMFDEAARRDKNVEPPDLNYWARQLNDVRDFDQLIYNVDRNQGNLLIDHEWRVWAIDHSRAFRLMPTLRDPNVLRRISNKLLRGMQNLREPDLEANLEPFISKQAIDAVMARRDLLVKFFETQISQKGPDVVLTDIPRHTERVTIP